MKVAFIARATLYSSPGGDTIQISQTAQQLNRMGIQVDVRLAGDRLAYEQYDLLHFFNLTRPADIIRHTRHTNKPYVISTILIDYSHHDKYHSKGITGRLSYLLGPHAMEYLKTVARWINQSDLCPPVKYLLQGQRISIHKLVDKAAMLLPNSVLEQKSLNATYLNTKKAVVVPNGIDERLFKLDHQAPKKATLVLCVARIERIKNQYNLIKALNNSPYQLIIIGTPAYNHRQYYHACRTIAGPNITFVDQVPQKELVSYYRQAKVHVLPSWFETCGLASLEAGAMECNLVITDKGFTREYFENYAFYCNPDSPRSIRDAIERAAAAPYPLALKQKILTHYTWRKAAEKTLCAYKQVLNLA